MLQNHFNLCLNLLISLLNDFLANRRSLAKFERFGGVFKEFCEWAIVTGFHNFESVQETFGQPTKCPNTIHVKFFGVKLYGQQIHHVPTVIFVAHDIVLTMDDALFPKQTMSFSFENIWMVRQNKQIFVLPKLHLFRSFVNCAHSFPNCPDGLL